MTRRGFSLIELLIVVATISLLLQLSLPAVEMSREAARQSHCGNNIRQLALASHLHLDFHQAFPSGGWTHHWVGDPNRGFGKAQPGGWSYSVLPFLEQGDVHDMGMGCQDSQRRKLGAAMFSTPISLFACPSRRPAKAWPFVLAGTLINVDDTVLAGRSDYAANMGDLVPSDQRWLGPPTLEDADRWSNGVDPETQWVATYHNGIVFQRSEVTAGMVVDGMTKTYLIGEKFMDPTHVKTGVSYGDDQSLYSGFDRDNARSGNNLHPPLRDKRVPRVWLPDSDSETVTDWNFGSSHPAGFHIAFCDGSVQLVGYDIDRNVHSASASRNGAPPTQ